MKYVNSYRSGGLASLPKYGLGGFLKGIGAGLISGTGIGGLLLPIGLEAFKHFRQKRQNTPGPNRRPNMPAYNFGAQQQYSPFGGQQTPFGIGALPAGAYGSFLQNMQSGMGPQFAPQYGMGGASQYGMGGAPQYGMYGSTGNINVPMAPRRGGARQAFQSYGSEGESQQFPKTYADGGAVTENISFEGFIPPSNDGTMESTGAVDDRIALAKPDISEVSPEKDQVLEVIKEAIKNMDQPWAAEIIALAKEMFGEEFVQNLMRDMDVSDGAMPMEADQDRLVEMQFNENLAKGGPVKVAAAVAPNEYVMTARQVRNIGGGSADEGAARLRQLGNEVDAKGPKMRRPMTLRAV